MTDSVPGTTGTRRAVFGLALVATAGSGALYALAFPPLSWRPVAWVCLVPFLVSLRNTGWKGGLALGWVWTLVVSLGLADALPKSVEHYFLQPKLASYALSLWVWTFTGCIYYMAFAAAYQGLAARCGRFLPLLAGAAWAGSELLRGRLLTGSGFFVGNPWALSAYSQAGWDALVQIASVTGVYGISFLIGAVNAALAELALIVWRRCDVRRTSWIGLALPAALVALAWLHGVVALRASDDEPGEPSVPVAIVQGNLKMGTVWRSSYYGRNLEEYLRLTYDAFRDGEPSIVFWPEGALSFFLDEEPLYRKSIAAILRAGSAELVVGGPRKAEPRAVDEKPTFYNTVFVVDEQADILDHYDKEYLLPFAEFFPLEGLDFLRRRFERVHVFRPGEKTSPVATRAGLAGMLICLEALLPEVAAARVRDGAEYLVSPSNDSWIEDERWAARMLDLVSFRAIEQRRYLVRASTSGPSAIVDPWGREQVRSEAFSRDVLQGAIRPRRGLSVYARVGDAFAVACVALVAAVLCLRSGRARP